MTVHPLHAHRKVLVAALVGTVVEHNIFHLRVRCGAGLRPAVLRRREFSGRADAFVADELRAGVRRGFLIAQLLASAAGLAGVMVAAPYADRTSPGRAMLVGCMGLGLVGMVFGPALGSRSLPIAAAVLCASQFAAVFVISSSGTWVSRLFPVPLRYSGFAVSFNVAGLIGGAMFPVAAQIMSERGWLDYVGLLFTGSAVLTMGAVLLVRSAQPDRSARAPTLELAGDPSL